jgi:hypothetical protein
VEVKMFDNFILEPSQGLMVAIQAAETDLARVRTPEEYLTLLETGTVAVRDSLHPVNDDIDMPQRRVDSALYGEWLDDFMKRGTEEYNALFIRESAYRQHHLCQLVTAMQERMLEDYRLTVVALEYEGEEA